MDTLSVSLLGVASILGGVVSDLLMRQQYLLALGFIVALGVCVGAREYFKLD